jgi:hypothetical protein
MKIKKFSEFNHVEKMHESVVEDMPVEYTHEQPISQRSEILGLADVSKKAYGGNNRKSQYFYDYYTGRKISGKSKYELNNKMFEMAKRNDEIGMIAQFCLQIEREGVAHDYDLANMIASLS